MALSALAAANARLGCVTGDGVALREEASTESKRLDRIDENVKVLILGSEGAFFKVKVNGQTGYISDDFVSVYTAKYGMCTTDSLNFRKSANTSSSVLATLDDGDEINVYGESGDFLIATFGNRMGYVYADYIEIYESAGGSSRSYSREATDLALLSDEEMLLLAKVVYAESGRTTEGYKAVASVLFNRLQSSKFPDSIYEIVYQEGQFSVADDLDKVTPDQDAIDAVRSVFIDGVVTLPSNVMFFRSARSNKTWGSRTYYATFGGNMFFS